MPDSAIAFASEIELLLTRRSISVNFGKRFVSGVEWAKSG
jgi:hypothetical protein